MMQACPLCFFQRLLIRIRSRFFFFNDTATTEIYTLSLHDALPISRQEHVGLRLPRLGDQPIDHPGALGLLGVVDRKHFDARSRSEEHTSELQSPDHLVCRLLLEKKKEAQGPAHSNLHARLRHYSRP